jgi:hypothetical protein
MTATTPLKKQIGLPPWSVHPINACPGGASLFAWSRQQHDCNDDCEPDNGSGNCEMDIPSLETPGACGHDCGDDQKAPITTSAMRAFTVSARRLDAS